MPQARPSREEETPVPAEPAGWSEPSSQTVGPPARAASGYATSAATEARFAALGLRTDAPFDTRGGDAWAASTLARLGTDARAAQLVVLGLPAGTRWNGMREGVLALIRDGLGGVLVPRAWPPDEVRRAVAEMQAAARVPLLVAADYERGAGRADFDRMTELPALMAFGAARDTLLAAAAGRLVAAESRALGVNWLFGPVVDVNRDPENPIINTRAYGERADDVSAMARAFVREAERGGLLTTLKHFPGHGDTATDSHSRLALVDAPLAVVEASDLLPYRDLFASDTPPAAVMVAHVHTAALDPVRRAATISPVVMTTLLRERLGFTGLVVTDDLEMNALDDLGRDGRIVRPLLAGADIALTLGSGARAIAAVRDAVASGQMSGADLDARVRRVLAAKARVGLHVDAAPDEARWRAHAFSGAHAFADTVARRSVTRLSARDGVLPLAGRVALVQIANVRASGSLGRALDAFRRELGPAVERRYDTVPTDAQVAALVTAASQADVVVVTLYQRLVSGRGFAGLRSGQERLVDALHRLGKPVVLVTMGNPYATADFPDADAVLVLYDTTLPSVRAAVAALRGGDAPGRLPVTSGDYRVGSGQ